VILLVDNYDSFTWNVVHGLLAHGVEVEVLRNDARTVGDLLALDPEAIVLGPGPGRPSEAGVMPELLALAPLDLPILGVCLGHQAIGQVFGGRIVRADRIMHGKLSKVFHDERGLYRGVPNPFEATRYHSLVIDRASMPDCLEITAKTWDDEIMGVRHKDFAGTRAPVEGVQFHPESIMTLAGHDLLRNFLEMRIESGADRATGAEA
jgi:anthranilate synthase/aminodeoxychorismate synthase-like glutamine amidotransferase